VNKKEAKKTLSIWARASETARAPDSESFLLLFFQKRSASLRLAFTRIGLAVDA
jgi:hypothetical protein